MACKARGTSSTPLAPRDVHPVDPPHEEGDSHGHKELPRPTETSCRRIKPTMCAAGFVHQAGQQRALLAAKEVAAKSFSVKPSTNQFDEFTLSPATGLVATPPPSETPLTNPCPSTTPSPTEQLDAPGSSVAANPKCVSPPVSPCADQTTGGPLRITKVQINPILLALSTALTLDLESTEEVNNEGVPPPSRFFDNLIAGVPTENVPNRDAFEAN